MGPQKENVDDRIPKYSVAASMFSAMVGNFAMNLLMQPFDILKMAMQASTVQQGPSDLKPTMLSVTRKIYREAGVMGFYRGTMMNFIGGGLIASYRWTVYRDQKLKSKHENKGESKMGYRIMNTSLMLGLFMPIITTPFDHARIRMNTKGYIGVYSNQLNGIYRIYKEHGARTLYRGNVLQVLRDVIFFAVFFTIFEDIRSYFDKQDHPFLGLNVASFTGAMAAWLISYPLDTIKTVKQSDSLTNPVWTTRGYLMHLKAQRRLGDLYQGIGSIMVRSVPINIVFFSVWDICLKTLDPIE
jgi:Mitochondrial carrier protein